MNSIKITNLNKSYGEKSVLINFSAEFQINSVTCVMGNSGVGKTTLLRIIAGLEEIDSGKIENLPDTISYVFQENRLCEDFSVISNIRFIVGNSLTDKEIESHLKEVGLFEVKDKPVKLLSGGMKRRVAIVRAICFKSELLLLDEPFKELDIELKKSLMEYVKNHTKAKTVILVTHDQSEADFFAGNLLKI